MTPLEQLQTLIERHSRDSFTTTAIPGLALMRSEAVSPCELPGVYSPMICLIAQGSKQVSAGLSTLRYNEAGYLVTSVDYPSPAA